MNGSFKLGKIAGIGIFIHWTFSILIAYIIFSNYRAGHSNIQIIWAVVFVLSIFATVFLHELGHALAAKKYHIKTKDITILPIGGLARLEKIPEKPMEEFVVAIAGPAVNIALALITFFFISFPDQETLLVQLSEGVNAENFFLSFFMVNIWLALFNLIPAFPMDGGRILRALLAMKFSRNTATKIAAKIGQVLAVGFVFVGFYINPFLIFIGIFIFLGAQTEANYTQAKSVLSGYKVRDVVMRQYESIDLNDNLDNAVKMLLDGQSKNFLVTQNKQPIGTLDRNRIIKALANNGGAKLVKSIMDQELTFLNPDTPLEEVYFQAQKNNDTLMLVMENNHFIGTLDIENIFEFIMIKEAQNNKTTQ